MPGRSVPRTTAVRPAFTSMVRQRPANLLATLTGCTVLAAPAVGDGVAPPAVRVAAASSATLTRASPERSARTRKRKRPSAPAVVVADGPQSSPRGRNSSTSRRPATVGARPVTTSDCP